MTCGWSVPKADLGVVGQPMSIGGKKFAHGVGTHAASYLRVDLGAGARSFSARVGVDDSAGGQGSVEFIVEGDGRVLWKSGVLTGGRPAVPVEVDVTGVRTLGLRVTDGGDGTSSDHADWAEAGIVMNEGASRPTSLPQYEMISLKTASFKIDFQIGGDGRLYQRAIGAASENERLQRWDECYPQSGDGYIWEPALEVVHADGNTSTALKYQGVTRTNATAGIELVRIRLADPAYPFEVALILLHPPRPGRGGTMDGDTASGIRTGDAGAHGVFRAVVLADKPVPDPFFWRLGRGNVESHHRANHTGHENIGLKNRCARGSIQ